MSSRMHAMERESIRVTRSVLLPVSEITLRVSRSSGPGGQHAQKSSTRVEAVVRRRGVHGAHRHAEAACRRASRAGAARRRAGRAEPVSESRARSRAARRRSCARRSPFRGAGLRRARARQRRSVDATASGAGRGRRRSGGRRPRNRLARGGRAPARIAASRASARANPPARQPRPRSPRGGTDHDGAVRRARRPHEHPPRRGARGRLVLLVPAGADGRRSRLHRTCVRLLRGSRAARVDAGSDRGRVPRALRSRARDDARGRDRARR